MNKSKRNTQQVDNEPMLTLKSDENGKPTQESINDMLSCFNFAELFAKPDAKKAKTNKTIDKN